jgi:hypothetical protein
MRQAQDSLVVHILLGRKVEGPFRADADPHQAPDIPLNYEKKGLMGIMK